MLGGEVSDWEGKFGDGWKVLDGFWEEELYHEGHEEDEGRNAAGRHSTARGRY